MKFNFAQLVGAKGGKAPTAETPAKDEDEPAAEDKEDDTVAEDDEEKPAAEDKEDDTVAEDDEDEPDAEDTEEEKAANAASNKKLGVEKRVAAARKAGRLAERRRIGTILSDKAAAGRIETALTLAVNTGMDPKAAITTLKTTPKSGRLASVMPAREPKIGADSPTADDKRVAAAGARYRASRGLKD
ncbi:hypothetical protein [Parvibaculum sp.]|uniref:hypothetical protein n=1 Tax=Parvibaculum sp. TaxID=2024848 RepID=UPI000C53B0EA|nr:hypothetical protein [Parvibaculum sp.]MAM95684.1 hypothetical protein [Parvibaculum sp.]|tara:strand:- start:12993 stop:13553 length:561 start_codon:yes stop_codon:yes gene_type:complete